MAVFVELETLKERVYADDTTVYDTRLAAILDNAERAIITMTDYDTADVLRIPVADFPAELKEAIVQLAAAWFAQPEAAAPVQYRPVPFSIAFLVKPYQRLAGGGRLESLIPDPE